MHTLISDYADKIVKKLGGAKIVERRGAVFAWTGWGLLVVFGCAGAWTPQFCGLICALATASHYLSVHARRMS